MSNTDYAEWVEAEARNRELEAQLDAARDEAEGLRTQLGNCSAGHRDCLARRKFWVERAQVAEARAEAAEAELESLRRVAKATG